MWITITPQKLDSFLLLLLSYSLTDVLVYGQKARSYQTSPCPNYSLWKKAIAIDGAVLKSSGEFHGDCRITFQVPYPDNQRFLLRFESVNIRECHDRLVIYDSDDLVDATRIDELSCRSHVDRTRYFYTSNARGYLTIRYYTYNKGEVASDFTLVITAVSKTPKAVFCNFRCANNHCISADLRCDADRINHCGDNSDELNCRVDIDANSKYESREFLGLSITVTIIISLSVLFVCGVCVCSVALFICKRNHVPLQPVVEAPPRSGITDAISSSDATSSTSRSHSTYTPVLTDIPNGHSTRNFHVKISRPSPSPLIPYHPKVVHSFPPTYPGTPRLLPVPSPHLRPGDENSVAQRPQYSTAEGSKKLLFF